MNMGDLIEDDTNKNLMPERFYQIAPFGLLFLFWEIVARTVLSTYDLPPFSVVIQALSPALIYHMVVTLAFSFLELLIISVAGLSLGKLICRSGKVKGILSPVFWFLIFAIGTAILIKLPILVVFFGLSKLLIILQSILVPVLVVALISGNGHNLLAIKLGYLLCLGFQIIGETTFGTTDVGIGSMLSVFYHLHNTETLYAALLLVGFAGLFVEEVFLSYVGYRLKIK